MTNNNWTEISDIRYEVSVAVRRLCAACRLTPREEQGIEYQALQLQQKIVALAEQRYGDPVQAKENNPA